MIISRRHFLAAGSAAFSISLLGRASAQDKALKPLRVATVFPSATGQSVIKASINDYIGDAGRMGAELADNLVGGPASQQGVQLKVLLANAPTVEAAIRAGERLVETEDIHALIGGIGAGQAEVLASIAEKAGIPFFNVGETADAFRGASCGRHTFHVEASDAMYLDALANLSMAQNYGRWFVVHEDSESGTALLQRAKIALTRAGAGEVVGAASVPTGKLLYTDEIAAAGSSGADVVVLLLDDADQIAFLSQQEQASLKLASLTLPRTLTQTRDYIAAARYRAPTTNPTHRIALWETTMTGNGAGDFNDRFRAQYGEPADPTAWSAYHAIKIITDTVQAIGTTEPDAVIAYLENPDTTFDLLKGPGVSFRPWDHQLRQPLYAIKVDQESQWSRSSLDSRIGIAAFDAEVPVLAGDDDPRERLDTLGDDASTLACKF
ncbi:MAG TPA: ABC transporter substrate-binding protein [Devosia sp.]|nr:ABC transporter substrate-binding protein [Devosia sp.]